jgi:hypothetical protein
VSYDESKYLVYERDDLPGRKTPIVSVLNKRRLFQLGTIKWHGGWRQYCFYPEPHTLFNVGCMNDIERVMLRLKGERS